MSPGPSLAAGGRPLAAIIAGSLALKLLLVALVAGMPCSHDQCEYLDLADGLLAGRGLQVHDGYLWPPGFIAFLAAVRAVAGDSLTPVRTLQALISTATVLPVFLIGLRAFGRRAALAAAAVFAFYPNLVGFTLLLWPATLYIFLFTVAAALLLAPLQVTRSRAAAAGLALGLAALVRGQALYFAPVAAAWVVLSAPPGERRRRLVPALVLLACTLLPVLPWTARNAVSYQRFLLLDATVGRNLYIGTNVPPPANWDFGFDLRRRVHGGRPRCQQENIVDRDRCEVGNAVAFVASHPGLMLRRIPLKWADLLNPSSFVIRHARLDKYPHEFGPAGLALLTVVAAGSWMAVAVLGLLGLLLGPAWRGRWLVAALMAYHLALHAVTFGMTRFRLPMVPFLIVAGAPLWAGAWSRLRAGATPLRLAAAGLGALALAVLWIARFPVVFDVFLPR